MANHSLVENVNSVITTFNQAKAALVEKGVEVSNLATDIPSEIARIEGGGEAGYYRYFNTTLSTSNKTFNCGFRPLKVMCTLKSGDVTYFSMAINDNGTTRGSRYGSAQANGESAINITLTDDGFTASVINTNYNGNAEFIAVSDQEPEPTPQSEVKFATGDFELTKGTALKELDLGFRPQVLILNQRTTNDYKTASARTFIYNESLSSTQYDSIVTTTVTKQAFGSTTVLTIYSIEDNGFKQRPHGSNTTYWSYYAVGGIDATPMLLNDDGGEE